MSAPAVPAADPSLPARSGAPVGLTETQVAAVDAPSSLAVCTQWLEGPEGARTGRTRLLLGGIHCAACAGVIEGALLRVDGVRLAEVNGAAERAVVEWDPARTRVSTLIEAVRAAGYGAFPDTGAEAVALARRESRRAIWRLFVAAFCMMQVMMYATPAYVAEPGDISVDMVQLLRWASWVLSVPVVLFAAGPFFQGAWRALRERRIGMDVPVSLGIAVTFVASSAATFGGLQAASVFGREVYFDSLTMFVSFLLAARLLESRARARAAQSLDAVMRRLPDAVERLLADGRVERVPAAELVLGDVIRVHAGQAFAADGEVLDGRTQVDEAMLTGESRPVERGPGDAVSAGCLNLGSPVTLRVTQLGAQTRFQRIVALVERALTERPSFLVSVDRIAGPFLWAVLALALGAYVVWLQIEPARAIEVAVAVLIVTCPCALSLGAPVAWLAAAGNLARRGVLLQRLDALEALTRVRHVVFDKTGTLTEDRLALALAQPLSQPDRLDATRVRAIADALAARSRHPLARALSASADAHASAGLPALADLIEQAGAGLQARVDGRTWRLGSAAWCGADEAGVERPAVWLAMQGEGDAHGPGERWQPLVRFEFDETLRADAAAAVASLQAAGLRTLLLSGDQPAPVARMAAKLGLGGHRARCTPQDKLDAVAVLQAQGEAVAMVGDGINDAPVLARADVSIAMGSAAALAQARADVIVLSDRIGDLVVLHDTAVRTVRIVRQNLAWALLYNLVSVPLALVGWLPPWLAGLGMALSSLLVVLNGLRLARDRVRSTPAHPLPAQEAGAVREAALEQPAVMTATSGA
ncbi:heavy metal translocating P-type ATPase [Leptothrix discophora]|uniref:Cation-translocating P-type ATPase n=1 Tax=Leptothrix discophora TaxID=89 RepID=A0ABT9FXZ5_LEPDI|nr:cation-translocating P-type ATPase [Leptothrix discophora]MDP4299025.1 cation-translocating P-type ATPase [Leptothrix discophora]